MSALEKLRVAAGTEKLAALRLRYMTSNNTDNFSEADLRELANSSFDIQNVLPIMKELNVRLNQLGHRFSVDKTLKLTKFLLCFGSADILNNYDMISPAVESLRDYHDDYAEDIAGNIRDLASEVSYLVDNKLVLEDERYLGSKELKKMNERKVIRAKNIHDQKLRKDFALCSAPIAGGF